MLSFHYSYVHGLTAMGASHLGDDMQKKKQAEHGGIDNGFEADDEIKHKETSRPKRPPSAANSQPHNTGAPTSPSPTILGSALEELQPWQNFLEQADCLICWLNICLHIPE